MNDYWPDVKSGENPQFWANEWTKDGICLQLSGAVSDISDFFNTTLSMYKQNDVMVD
jgi:hypothetical protein